MGCLASRSVPLRLLCAHIQIERHSGELQDCSFPPKWLQQNPAAARPADVPRLSPIIVRPGGPKPIYWKWPSRTARCRKAIFPMPQAVLKECPAAMDDLRQEQEGRCVFSFTPKPPADAPRTLLPVPGDGATADSLRFLDHGRAPSLLGSGPEWDRQFRELTAKDEGNQAG